jgi:hypothetical protein
MTNIAKKTKMRLRIMLRHYFDARTLGGETGNQELPLRRNRSIINTSRVVNGE